MAQRLDPRRGGFALVLVLFVLVVTAALIAASVTLGANHLLVNRYHARNDRLNTVATAGLEEARSMLNGDKDLYPDEGYVTLESNSPVSDGQGGTLQGVTRSLYAGPLGITSGQYGVFGVVVSVAEDEGGAISVRRLVVNQESFAKYAYFTDVEPSNISFGGGDQIWGPVHTNDYLKIYSSGATFHDEAKTAKTVQGSSYGTFKKGYVENVSYIPMPTTADLAKLKVQAQSGSTSFNSNTNGGVGEAEMRIEFVDVDVNGDGDTTDDNEGFIKVYTSNNENWVSGDVPDWNDAINCGHVGSGAGHPVANSWASIDAHPKTGGHDWQDAVLANNRACYLGGSDILNANAANPLGRFVANDGNGQWMAWPNAIHPLVNALARDDKAYLFPISRAFNPNFKGVIYVEGKVVVSGRLRGSITLAASNDIIIGDDVQYVTNPGAGTCEDLLGLFSGTDVVVADNSLNAAQQARAQAGSGAWYTFDETRDEFIDGVVLALSNFTVENYANGATLAQPCGTSAHGRGCLFLTGGIIQNTRGAVGTLWWSGGGTGYLKRYSYDKCAATNPPPYFPTTGHFIRNQIFPVNPTGFSVSSYFAELQS